MAAAAWLWALAVLCASLFAFELASPLRLQAPTLRAILETTMALCALAAARLFGLSFLHGRRLRDLLMVAALVGLAVVGLAAYALPARIDLRSGRAVAGESMLGELLVAAAFAGAVLAGPNMRLRTGRRALAIAVAGGVGGAALAGLIGVLLRGQLVPAEGLNRHGMALAAAQPGGLGLVLATVALLTVAAVRIGREPHAGRSRGNMLVLATGFIALAADRLHYLVLAAPGLGWVTPSAGARLAGLGLILAAAMRQEAAIRRTLASDAALQERRRIARDLHDGLAQDLAFIAAHGDRIAREAGPDHPLAIAARRALAVSRGAIADLSAADAPTPTAALRRVADELETRFAIRVDVDGEGAELDPTAREDVLRIAREAIVNAAHAEARHVVVSLARDRGQFVLRVRDDGPGIASTPTQSHPGFGLRSMRERAASLGGGVTARQAAGGGTELEVVFP